jgi:hypothetical protein
VGSQFSLPSTISSVFMYGVFNDISSSDSTDLISELERMWKESVMAWFDVYLGICLEGLSKTMRNVRLVGFPNEKQAC